MLLTFKKYTGVLQGYLYHDGKAICLKLESPIHGPIATITANHHEQTPIKGCVFIKDYSENEGMVTMLKNMGIIGQQVRSIPTGHTELKEHALTPAAGKYLYLNMRRRYGDEFDDDTWDNIKIMLGYRGN